MSNVETLAPRKIQRRAIEADRKAFRQLRRGRIAAKLFRPVKETDISQLESLLNPTPITARD